VIGVEEQRASFEKAGAAGRRTSEQWLRRLDEDLELARFVGDCPIPTSHGETYVWASSRLLSVPVIERRATT
jgi:hypothetical protein